MEATNKYEIFYGTQSSFAALTSRCNSNDSAPLFQYTNVDMSGSSAIGLKVDQLKDLLEE